MKSFVLALFLSLSSTWAELLIQMEPGVHTFSSPNWKQGARVTESEKLRLQVFLKHDENKVKEFEEELLKRASPSSPVYGQWFSADEVTRRLSPGPEAADPVMAFLKMKGAENIEMNRHLDVVNFDATGPVAEAIVGTALYHYSHVRFSKVDIVRVASPYFLPLSVAQHVSLVAELIRFPSLRQSTLIEQTPVSGADSDSDSWDQCGTVYKSFVNPAVLAERYGYPTVTDVASGNGLALAEFQGQYYDDGDLEAFSSQCNLDTTVTVTTTNGGNTPSRCTVGLEPCVESLLDIEYAGSVAANIPLTVYYSSSYSLLEWAAEVGDDSSTPPVHSVSYGNDEVQQTSDEYMYSCNTEFMKLASKGISVLFASGDQGVWGRTGFGTEFHPDFPADSPYITAVGGTDFVTKSTIGDEKTWEDGGGGFSNVFAQPSWQADAVESFFSTSTDLPASSLYNSTGRGYPDVAALAGTQNAYFISYKDGHYSGVGGTSAACPVVASIFAIINNERLAAGKSAMGWLNPFIYENPDAFNDVTSGTNSGGYTSGFTAIEGWDAATGYGTPNWDNLYSAAMSS